MILRIGISGTILNHQLNAVKPKINKAVMTIAKVNLKIETGSLLFSLLLDFAKVNNNRIPQIPVPITHKLEYCSSETISFLFKIAKTNILRITVSPTGKALTITFFKNSPFILSLFGSKAKIKDGKPIVMVPIRLICIGTNG